MEITTFKKLAFIVLRVMLCRCKRMRYVHTTEEQMQKAMEALNSYN